MAEAHKIRALPHGLHRGFAHADYHERIPGMVSKSALDKVHRSPAHYKAWVDGAPDEESEALMFGGAFHCALLEPDDLNVRYAAMPRWDDLRDKRGALSTKAGKEAKAQWLADNEGKDIIGEESVEAMGAMIASIRKHPLASKMIVEGVPEVTLRWKDKETGLECRARADYYVAHRKMVVDVKTAANASAEEFKRSVVKWRYHVQDALYREAFGAIGEPIQHFAFVVVEKTPPYAVAVYTLDSEGIQRGYAHATRDIATLAECMRNDAFPGYPNTIQILQLPPWAA